MIFVCHGATLGHVSGHVGMCHMDVQENFKNQTKIEGVVALTIKTRPGVQQCQAQGQVFCP